MNDIEKVLQSVTKATPRRRVRTSFTNDVLDKINHTNDKERKGAIFMRLFQKPLIATLSIIFVLASGATAFAAIANWPAVVSVFVGEQPLDSGARVVKIETEGCKPVDGSDSKILKRVSYYEIKKDSTLTNEQAVAMMQGICEEERVQSRVGEFVQQAGGTVHSTSIYTIEAIAKDSLKVVADKKYEDARKDISKTYTAIAPDVQVSDGTADLHYSDLKPGDSVVLVIADKRGMSTEMQGYTEDIASMQVKAILKVPALTGNPDLFYRHLGKDFVRVEPSKDGKTFNRVYEFEQ